MTAAGKVVSDQLTALGKRSRWPQVLLRAGISGGILGWLLWRLEWPEVLALVRQSEPDGWLIALVLYGGVQLGLSSYRWRVLGRALGFYLPWWRYLQLYYVGVFFNLFLPTSMGGDVIRALNLTREPGRRLAAGWSVVSDRLSGLMALVLLACGASLLQWQAVATSPRVIIWLLALGLIFGPLVLVRLGRQSPRLGHLATALSLSRAYRREFLAAFALSLAVQAASIVQIAWLGRALGIELGLLGYAVVVPLVSLATMLPVSISGIGVREGSFVIFLASYGVPPPAAVALGLAWFLMNVIVGVIGGVVYLLSGAAQEPGQSEGAGHGSVGYRAAQGRAGQLDAAA
jgi:uncharacterized membrane protein YbhN (UPF0104 family)